MLNDIPEEILEKIIEYNCITPCDYILFKNINKRCYEKILNFKNKFKLKENNYEEKLSYLCNSHTLIKTFDWLFENDVEFTLGNIKLLIVNNRLDVLKKGCFHRPFLDTMFNRFYFDKNKMIESFTMMDCLNPLIVASSNNKISIIRFLLETSTVGNPYTKMVESLFDISLKYNYKNLLSYLIIYQYHEIDEEYFISKINSIIYRISNCEDILFHLLITKNVRFESKHYQGIISKHYNELFKYILKNENFGENYMKNLLSFSLVYNNIEIFNLIFQKIENSFNLESFSQFLFENRYDDFFEDKKCMVYNLVNNYINIINKNSSLLHLCIKNDFKNEIIINLINNNYVFIDEDMNKVLSEKKWDILEAMCIQKKKLSQ